MSLSDGRAFCYLVHHYYSSVLQRELIRTQTCLSCGVSRPSFSKPTDDDVQVSSATDVDELLANEKYNFKLLSDAVSLVVVNQFNAIVLLSVLFRC